MDEAVVLAVADLQADFGRTLNAGFRRCDDPLKATVVLVNLEATSWPGLKIEAGQWERYEIAVQENRIIIAGSDRRGLLYGIYQFSRRVLGVDPLWFWIPETPKPLERADARRAVTVSGIPTFKYRGWFINGEDLLEEWDYGSYREAVDWYGVKHKAISYETYDRLFQTMLRLRVNLIIPATVMDIADAETRQVYEMIRRRGLLFSQHHIEPVGVCPSYAFRNYCRRHNHDENFSWTNNRDVVEDCWREHINLIAEFEDSVVWQLGYRGAGDVPFWKTESNAPTDMPSRAAVINNAVARQYALIRERVGTTRRTPCTATLWWEGNVLYKQGLLRFPEEVMVIISDVARTQMLPRPLPTRDAGRKYGIYYHTSYWSTGPHAIQGNPPSNVFENYRFALSAGAREYSMHHVSNLRPFLPIVQGVADFTFNSDAFNEKAYMGDYCEKHFGLRCTGHLYEKFFAAFVHRDEDELRLMNARWLDGALGLMTRRSIALCMEYIGKPAEQAFGRFMSETAFRLQLIKGIGPIPDVTNHRNPDSWLSRGWCELYRYAQPLLSDSLGRWRELVDNVESHRASLESDTDLYDSNLYWQSIVGRELTFAALNSLKAMACWEQREMNQVHALLVRIADALDNAVSKGRELAEQDHFRGWTGGDRYMGMRSMRDQLRGLAEALQRPAPARSRAGRSSAYSNTQ